MTRIIAVANQKGGTGKSTTAAALGAGLVLRGYKVLYVDLDAQGNLSYSLGATDTGLSILDVLVGNTDALTALQHTQQGDIIASCAGLASADTVITSTGKEYKLREALAPIKGKYDFIIIDTAPALGILTVNALTACTWAIVPAQADIFSLQGIGQLYTTIDAVRRYCNPELTIKGILLTRHNSRTILSRDLTAMIEQTAERLHTKLFTTVIRETVTIKEAQASQQGIFDYSPKSNAAQDYGALLDEILEGE